MNYPERQIRANYTSHSIRVYQAYSNEIADAAIQAGTFTEPTFKMERMTWIKPSFFWMMYRAGWGYKKKQERILAIDITRKGFEWALSNSCLSHYEPAIHINKEKWKNSLNSSNVRIQWDPERNIEMDKLNYRTIQIGLSGSAVKKYVNEWIIKVTDITDLAREINNTKNLNLIHSEKEYPFVNKNISLF